MTVPTSTLPESIDAFCEQATSELRRAAKTRGATVIRSELFDAWNVLRTNGPSGLRLFLTWRREKTETPNAAATLARLFDEKGEHIFAPTIQPAGLNGEVRPDSHAELAELLVARDALEIVLRRLMRLFPNTIDGSTRLAEESQP